MRHLIIGAGEVGQGLQKVIGGDFHDPQKGILAYGEFDMMHVCIPALHNFIKIVKQYQKDFKPKYTVIHSSVPIGTSKACDASHSPIRGVHPNLDLGIKTFVKYVGGRGANSVAEEFNKHGIKTKVLKDARTCEAGKLWDTTQYGWNILLNKAIHSWCEQNDVDFDAVYHDFNTTYNEGYLKLDRPEVVRPHLKFMEGKIGGHCVIQNCDLLESDIATYILKYNKLL